MPARMANGRLLGLLGAAILASACESFPAGAKSGHEPPRAQVVEVNGTKLSARVYGSGAHPIVFLQGAQLPCEMWEEQAQAFAREHLVVLYDVRGFGKSGPTGEPFAHENDLRALLDALAIDRATLVGLSLGGRIAVEFAIEHPERVEALVLVGAGLTGFPYEEPDPPWRQRIHAAIEAKDGRRAAEAWLGSGYMEPAMADPEVAPRVRELALANAGAWLQPDSEVPPDPPAIRRLADVRCPTLVVVGSRDVPKILAIADHLEREIPGAHKSVMTGCGHVPNLERPAEFDKIVRGFLAGVR
jgi:pimeloyl-ACP methyl ester carboxylesterase